MPVPAYVELHCWSNFSFLEGSSHPEELIAHGRRLGLSGIALTDRDGLYGMVRFTKAAATTPFAALCGAELTLETAAAEPIRPSRPARPSKEVPTDTPRLVLIAADKRGFGNLARLISTAQLRGRKRDARLRLDDLEGCTDGLIALSGGRNGIVEKALLRRDGDAAVVSTSSCSITCGPKIRPCCARWCGSLDSSTCRTSRRTGSRTRRARTVCCATC
jgi:error-prone DNA polymerase